MPTVNDFSEQPHDPAYAEVVGSSEAEQQFLDGMPQFVSSSLLAVAEYNRQRQELHLTFVRGHQGWYEPISEDMAIDFYRAPSKGIWFHTRILAGRDGFGGWNHQVNYRTSGAT
jgi:hypothetical protein